MIIFGLILLMIFAFLITTYSYFGVEKYIISFHFLYFSPHLIYEFQLQEKKKVNNEHVS